jgi:hypothetical protein
MTCVGEGFHTHANEEPNVIHVGEGCDTQKRGEAQYMWRRHAMIDGREEELNVTHVGKELDMTHLEDRFNDTRKRRK